MFVKKCLICQRPTEGGVICSDCKKALRKDYIDNFAERCPICFFPVQDTVVKCPECGHFDFPIYSISLYSSWSRNVLELYKFHNVKQLAKVIAKIYLENIQKLGIKNPVIVPVPCSQENFKKRGWDHMVEICKQLPFEMKNILISSGTGQQKEKDFENRKQQKFFVNKEMNVNLKNRNIILIDDIYTSGYSLKAAYDQLDNDSCVAVTWFLKI